jgi:2-amino-4-hydroxy-6-hydroxymethyldihydropteridine diphosphokinase
MWYLCGLGSNIEPQKNLAETVVRLLHAHGSVWLSPVVHTQPKGIETERSFLNALVVVFSLLPPGQLKNEMNALEESLGRDRSDPMSSLKDRPIDIDILEYSATGMFTGSAIEEPYYQELFSGVTENVSARVAIRVMGHALGKAPATIHRDLGTGDVVIVEEGQNLHHHAVKATLAT